MAKRGHESVPDSSRKSLRQDSSSNESSVPSAALPQQFTVKAPLPDINANPSSLIENIGQLHANQQMRDLYDVVRYNGAQRAPIEAIWQQWVDCRGPREPDFMLNVIEYPLHNTKDACHIVSTPNKILRAVATYHNIIVEAESEGLKPLSIEASKKMTDYILLYQIGLTPRPPMETSIPDWHQWLTQGLKIISDGISEQRPPSPGLGPSTQPPAAEPAGAVEENTANLSAAIDGLLYKPGKNVPILDDIALDSAVRNPVLTTLCMPLLLPHLFKAGRVVGLLLHGLPGCGKTLVVKAAAKQYNLTLFNVNAASVSSKWQGESEKFITRLFERAIQMAPSIIFIDEVDSMMSTHSNDSASIDNVKSLIRQLWQNLSDGGHQVVLVGATHNPEAIDPAFLRRFHHRIHVKLPSLEAKSKILKLHLRKQRHSLKTSDIHDLVHDKELMRHVSGDDIVKAVHAAESVLHLEVMTTRTWMKVHEDGKEIIIPASPTNGNRAGLITCSWQDFNDHDRVLLHSLPMTKQHLIKAFTSRRPTCQGRAIDKHYDWARTNGTSC